jgi:hypothetical protein
VALSMAERRAITREMAKRYAKVPKKQRGLMLDLALRPLRLQPQLRGPPAARQGACCAAGPQAAP